MAHFEEAGNGPVVAGPTPNQPATLEEVDALATSKSTRSPAFQFYPKDFLSSRKVDLMSMTERGVYITLMCRYWLDGGLPADAKQLSAIVRMKPKQFERGWYVEPTIFYDVDNDAKIAQEEIFVPVMSVIPFRDEADAIRIANASPYGLAAAVWTRDIFKAFRVVKALEAGIVWVNHMQPTFVEAPWGGYKMSGFGRELGHWGVEEYLETKQVFINLDEKPIGWY